MAESTRDAVFLYDARVPLFAGVFGDLEAFQSQADLVYIALGFVVAVLCTLRLRCLR